MIKKQGIFDISNLVEFRFNHEKWYSCNDRPGPDDSSGIPYSTCLDNTTCQLIILNAIEIYSGDYHCRVKIRPKDYAHKCYLLSRKITLSMPVLHNEPNFPSTNTTPTPTPRSLPITTILATSLTAVALLIMGAVIAVTILCTRHYCPGRKPQDGNNRDNEHGPLLDPQREGKNTT